MSTQKTELVILVMGATGVGKSHFVNTLLKAQKMPVCKDPNSCTVDVDFGYVDAPKEYPQYRIALVDTPGFHDTEVDDFRILRRVMTWLKQSYQRGAKLGGVIYLHDITAPRFGLGVQNLQMFLRMSARRDVPIVVGTTKGGRWVPGSLAHESQLVNNSKYWRPLIAKGAQVLSFDNSYESAWRSIDAILSVSKIYVDAAVEKTQILILVMGATGVGKSQFINTLLKAEKMAVGRDLNSCTLNVDFGYMDPREYPQYRIALVDTPGFNQAALKDSEVLERITDWLKQAYQRGAKLGGVVYLYDVTAPYSASIGLQHLQKFRQMVVQDVPIVLGTTKRALAVPGSVEHQSRLLNHWKPLIDKGAQAFSFDNSYGSAWTLIDAILTRKTEISILVLGATGVGKSQFINTLLRAEKMAVGTDLNSCTVNVDFGYMDDTKEYPQYRIALVDTPGFSEAALMGFQVLEGITAWLKQSYKRGAKLGGVIYLYDITAPRFDGAARRNIQMLRNMWKEDVPIVLGTTKGALAGPDSEGRLSQLKNNPEYWKPLIDKGAQAFPFDNSYESAWIFIRAILSGQNLDALYQPVPQIYGEVEKYCVAPHLPKKARYFAYKRIS